MYEIFHRDSKVSIMNDNNNINNANDNNNNCALLSTPVTPATAGE